MNRTGLIGKQIANFKILDFIGQGSLGVVYRACDVLTNEICALKLLVQSSDENDLSLTRLSREVQALAKLRHPNIVRGLGCGRFERYYYFAMECVNGESLEDLYKRRGALKEKTALPIVISVAKALQHAYRQGVIHRDIKPANILITKEGEVKVTDFGMAKTQRVTTPGKDRDTPFKVAVGTPRYMSPEQAKGQDALDIRADIYSLGITLFTIIAGEFPYQGSTPEIMAQHISTPLPNLRDYATSVSDATVEIISKMTAKAPENRYQTPSDLLVELFSALMLLPAALPTPPEPMPAVGTQTTAESGTFELIESGSHLRVLTPEALEEAEEVFYIISGNTNGKFFILQDGEELVLGRDGDLCHVTVLDSLVSRKHCVLSRKKSTITITDLNTTNGTMVNSVAIKSKVLEPGDVIQLGNTVITRKKRD